MRFDLVTLNLVLAIADTRSITRGAEREHLALAAASKRLSDLESRLGITLFERRARGVEITAAGRALVHHIRNLQTTLHALESEVAEFAQGIQGQLRVVANASAIAEFLPSDLARFSKAHPGIRVSLEDRTSAEIQQLIAEGTITAAQGDEIKAEYSAALDENLAKAKARDQMIKAYEEIVKIDDLDWTAISPPASTQDTKSRTADSGR